MDKKKNDSATKHHVTYFHEIIVDVSKLLTNDEKTQENIQIGVYSIVGIFVGLALFNNNKKNEEKN